MFRKPVFCFFLSDHTFPVTEKDRIWRTPLPASPLFSDHQAKLVVTYGEYFFTIQAWLEKDRCSVLETAISKQTGKKNVQTEMTYVNIFLEKHGEYYHPARCEIGLSDRKIQCVINVAISEIGQKILKQDCAFLEALHRNDASGYIPDVYAMDTCVRINETVKCSLFLGQWFEGYHEFHLSDAGNGQKQIVVWTPGENVVLSDLQAEVLYAKATAILTHYFNPYTGAHIASWHHAAGDFILKFKENDIDVRLITVRKYARPFGNESQECHTDPQTILDMTLLFFINLSIRMRLDRLDGTGDMVWANDIALRGIITGFFDSLRQKPTLDCLPASLDFCFAYHLLDCHSEVQLYDVARHLVSKYPPNSVELSIITDNLEKHIADIRTQTCRCLGIDGAIE